MSFFVTKSYEYKTGKSIKQINVKSYPTYTPFFTCKDGSVDFNLTKCEEALGSKEKTRNLINDMFFKQELTLRLLNRQYSLEEATTETITSLSGVDKVYLKTVPIQQEAGFLPSDREETHLVFEDPNIFVEVPETQTIKLPVPSTVFRISSREKGVDVESLKSVATLDAFSNGLFCSYSYDYTFNQDYMQRTTSGVSTGRSTRTPDHKKRSGLLPIFERRSAILNHAYPNLLNSTLVTPVVKKNNQVQLHLESVDYYRQYVVMKFFDLFRKNVKERLASGGIYTKETPIDGRRIFVQPVEVTDEEFMNLNLGKIFDVIIGTRVRYESGPTQYFGYAPSKKDYSFPFYTSSPFSLLFSKEVALDVAIREPLGAFISWVKPKTDFHLDSHILTGSTATLQMILTLSTPPIAKGKTSTLTSAVQDVNNLPTLKAHEYTGKPYPISNIISGCAVFDSLDEYNKAKNESMEELLADSKFGKLFDGNKLAILSDVKVLSRDFKTPNDLYGKMAVIANTLTDIKRVISIGSNSDVLAFTLPVLVGKDKIAPFNLFKQGAIQVMWDTKRNCLTYFTNRDTLRGTIVNGHGHNPFKNLGTNFIDDNGNYMPLDTVATPNFKGDKPLFGLELEVCTVHTRRNTLMVDGTPEMLCAQTMGKIGIVSRDGSIGDPYGMELVSIPMTLKGHTKSGVWDAFFEKAAPALLGWKEPTCGIHIHISKDSFTPLSLAKFDTFINNAGNRDFVTRVAGRTANSYNNYDDACGKITQSKTVKNLAVGSIFSNSLGSRYRSVNLNKTPTVEIRIFQSNVSKRGFFKNIEFLAALHNYVTNVAPTKAEYLTWQAFVTWLHKDSSTVREYPNFVAWLAANKIVEKLEQSIQTGQYKLPKHLLKKSESLTPEQIKALKLAAPLKPREEEVPTSIQSEEGLNTFAA
jgi:hypothetical protein